MIDNLLKIGWNVNSKVEGGLDLLKKACEKDDLFRLNLLINAGLKLDSNSEFEKVAIDTAKHYSSNLILERINNVKILSISNNLQLVTISNDSGDQLIEACQNNNFDKVKALVEKGVDVNYRNHRGSRPIHKACASANLVIVEYLIVKGAEINCVDLSGRCPLHEACTSIYDRQDVVKKLLKNNAKVSYFDQDKNTQLHLAIIGRKFAVAELLVDHYDNVNLLNIFDESPLHLAADFAPKSLIEKLIEKGSEINAKDFNGRTALHRAVTSNTINVVDLLLSKGANVNQVDNNKDSPVLLSIKRADALPFITSLIKYEADLNLKNSSGKAALEITWELKIKA